MNTRSSTKKRSLHDNNRPLTSSPLRSPPAGAVRSTVHQGSSAPEDQSVASPSVTSVSSSRSRAGLSLHIQKQLATDIEAAGGIKVFIGSEHKLSEVLTNREELHGKRADLIRTAISKKVYRWQLLDRDGACVEKVLNRFKISSHAVRQAEERETLKTTIKKQQQQTKTKRQNLSGNLSLASSSSSGSSSDSSSSSSSSIGKVAASAPKLPPVVDFPPRFIDAPTSKTTATEAKQRTPKLKKLFAESFPPPVEANMSRAASSPRSPSIPLPRDTGE
jgi:hypothetical protein